MVDIAIQGINGRMGQALLALIAQRDDCRVVAGVDTAQATIPLPCPVFESVEQLANVSADVLVDFSHPDATLKALQYCAGSGLACVVCTTGLGEDARQEMEMASANAAIFFSANMSLGVNLMAELACRAQAVLKGFDIEIVEKHHNKKLDAPSGTALMLADRINQQADGAYHYVYNRQPVRQPRQKQELGIHAVRGGSIVGEHDVLFAGPHEVLTLSHTAYSREVFANGAVAAAVFLAGKSAGMYSMKNIMEQL